MLTETKLFALHDRATLLTLMVQRLEPETEEEEMIMSRAGYRDVGAYFFYATFSDDVGEFTYDTYKLSDTVTTATAARYISQHFDELESGILLDCEVLRGERDEEDAHTFEEEFNW